LLKFTDGSSDDHGWKRIALLVPDVKPGAGFQGHAFDCMGCTLVNLHVIGSCVQRGYDMVLFSGAPIFIYWSLSRALETLSGGVISVPFPRPINLQEGDDRRLGEMLCKRKGGRFSPPFFLDAGEGLLTSCDAEMPSQARKQMVCGSEREGDS